jgi:hypothetical protein
MGKAGQDCKDRTNRTGLPAQGCKNKTARTRQKEMTAEKTARTGQLDRTGRSIQSEPDSQNETVRKGHPGQGKQTGETEQDF